MLDDFCLEIHFDCNCKDLKKPCTRFKNIMESPSKSDGLSDLKDKIFNCKSVGVYQKWHDKFKDFILENHLTENLESILQYFNKISDQYSPSTLWQAYSCLNKYYTTYRNWKSFNETPLLKNFIKKMEKDSASKKQSSIFSKEEIFQFLGQSSNEDKKLLVKKAVTIIAYYGGLRCAELVALTFKDIAINEHDITVFIRTCKTDPQGKSKFYFTIPQTNDEHNCPYKIIQMYYESVQKKVGRFFQNFNLKSQQFSGQPMGRNTIGAIPKFIATYLKLDNPESYTGHCFRRSSATALADSGATMTTLKRTFRWKSDTVAEGYIDQSKCHKIDVAKSLTINTAINTGSQIPAESSKVVHITNCSNVIINL